MDERSPPRQHRQIEGDGSPPVEKGGFLAAGPETHRSKAGQPGSPQFSQGSFENGMEQADLPKGSKVVTHGGPGTQVSDSSNRQIAQTFLEGLRNRDWASIRAIMADDIVWSLPGSSRISGETVGVEEVLGPSQTIVSYGLSFGLKHVLYGTNGVALSLNITAKKWVLHGFE